MRTWQQYLQRIETNEFTPADVDSLSGLGMQFELIDGVLMVTPPRGPVHHATSAACLRLLIRNCPSEHWVMAGSCDYRPSGRLCLQPDGLVCRREDIGPNVIEHPLLLAVEVLSPATRVKDLVLKRALYEQTGVASCWMLEPDEAVLTVLELVDGRYVERVVVRGDEVFEAKLPFPVRVVPSELVG
ncbi:Uma2 family endonuclease [Kribbella sp. VKM Ac-2568]|uniref:Uma2 family endonuclease n=1 Tax=Kribbella sp. VKM Ac-2568 TaxID=2512219 RepID=UPI001F546538|nr:Uma2 family endonuclease [Kribbella sp. VKM Ac-2568]